MLNVCCYHDSCITADNYYYSNHDQHHASVTLSTWAVNKYNEDQSEIFSPEDLKDNLYAHYGHDDKVRQLLEFPSMLSVGAVVSVVCDGSLVCVSVCRTGGSTWTRCISTETGSSPLWKRPRCVHWPGSMTTAVMSVELMSLCVSGSTCCILV